MKKDKKIKNMLLDEPSITFDEFCRANSISAEPAQALAPKKRGVKGVLFKFVMPTVATAAVVLAVVLPVALSGDAQDSGGGNVANPLMYSNPVTYEEIESDPDVTLMNAEFMYDKHTAFGKMFSDSRADESSHVGYTVTTDVYGARVNGVPYAYGFTLTTAKSTALAVIDKSDYHNCDKTVTYSDVDYNYNVRIGFTADMRVYYTIGKYEYYLSVTPFGTASTADEEYMLMFLRLAFDSVDNAVRLEVD